MFDTSMITRTMGTITNDIAAYKGLFQSEPSEWAIVRADDTTSAIEFNVFIDMDVSGEGKIIQSPTEEGSFVMYNKTSSPISIGLKVAIKGQPYELDPALEGLIEMADSTDLVNIITPEREYQNFNIYKFAFARKAEEGIDVIYCDLGLMEVRQVTSQYTNAKVAHCKKRGRQQAPNESFSHKIASLF